MNMGSRTGSVTMAMATPPTHEARPSAFHLLNTFRDGRGFDLLLVALTLGYLIVFGLAPILYTVLMSLQTVDMFTLGDLTRPFVGLANYMDVLTRPEAGMVARHTLVH